MVTSPISQFSQNNENRHFATSLSKPIDYNNFNKDGPTPSRANHPVQVIHFQVTALNKEMNFINGGDLDVKGPIFTSELMNK